MILWPAVPIIPLEVREQHDADGNAAHLLAPDDAAALARGDWLRAGGEAPCPECARSLWRHERALGALWLTRLCDGRLVKL